jgi:hypothetical protein|tara:strand:- start:30 stop:812 length:783 start_codon:yes stop_codon:yes gene_type:complete
MPTAESFNALGAGNGFPFCLYSINVNDSPNGNPYTHWATLGGTEKGGSSATQVEIDLSLVNAMKLFWNYNGHTTTSTISPYSITLDIDEEEYNNSSFKRPSPFFSNPVSRVCAGNGWKNPNGTDLAYWSISQSPSGFSAGSMRNTISIVRMYEGAINNEDNFIGYGNSSQIFSGFGGYVLEFRSLFYEGEPITDPWPGNSVVFKYTTLDGNNIPIVARAVSANQPTDTVTISDNQTATFGRVGYNTQTVKHQDFDFYTYA